MFTGIAEGMAVVQQVTPRAQAYRLTLDLGPLVEDLRVGDSVAVDGTCLTAVLIAGTRVDFDVIPETIERTAFAAVRVGERVNVERSMRAGDRFHGHIVSGHVDGTGRVVTKRPEGGQVTLELEVPPRLSAFMIEKGSITLNGVSLTLTHVEETRCAVALIPHTLEITTLGRKEVGSLINVEVDQLGKWVHKLLTAYVPGDESTREGNQGQKDAAAGPRIIVDPGSTLGLSLDDLRRR